MRGRRWCWQRKSRNSRPGMVYGVLGKESIWMALKRKQVHMYVHNERRANLAECTMSH